MFKGAGRRVVVLFGERLRVAEVRGDRFNHLRILKAATGPRLPEVGGFDPAEAGKALGDLLHRNGIRTKRAVAVIPAKSLMFRTLQLPSMPDPELTQAAWGEVEGYVRIPPEEVLFGYLPLGEVTGEGGVRRVQVFTAVASRRVVEGYRQALQASGLRPEGIEVGPLAALRALLLRGFLKDAGPVCTVVFGDTAGAIAIAAGGQLRLLRISEMDHLPERFTETLLVELRASIRYYESQVTPGVRVNEIIAILDGPEPPNLVDSLRTELGLPVQFAELSLSAAPDREAASSYFHAVVAGAVLARTDRGLALPLRPVERRRVRRRVPLDQVLALLTILATLGTALGVVMVGRELASTREQLQRTRREAQELQAQLTARREEAARQAKSISAALGHLSELPRPPWSLVLAELDRLPRWVWLTSVEAKGTTMMVIEGVSLSPADVAALLGKLAMMEAFDSVVLRQTQEEKLGGRRVVRFRIEAGIRPSWALRKG